MSRDADTSDVVMHLRRREMAYYQAWLVAQGTTEDERLYADWLRALRAWLDERASRGAGTP
jgi:hypothetical protein